ncbi:NADH dehydrogenase [ubiquinone] 1 beta subcomplex subunit 3-like [Argonauta hians]
MGGEKFVIPDWRQYKVEDAPRLQILERRLASRGLKDPWIRNEVWRYNTKNWSPVVVNMKNSLSFGFKYALAAMAITIVAEKFNAKIKERRAREKCVVAE